MTQGTDKNLLDGGDQNHGGGPEEKPPQNRGPFPSNRNAAMMSAPTILIVYPLVGFGLGYLTVRFWHWPEWVQLVTLLMGFVQGLREVYRLGTDSAKRD
jgi:F0F1-type ATP synthase assembly protein I